MKAKLTCFGVLASGLRLSWYDLAVEGVGGPTDGARPRRGDSLLSGRQLVEPELCLKDCSELDEFDAIKRVSNYQSK